MEDVNKQIQSQPVGPKAKAEPIPKKKGNQTQSDIALALNPVFDKINQGIYEF